MPELTCGPAAVGDVRMIFDLARAIREDQPELALRACQLPFPQRIDNQRCHRNRALAGFGLRRPHLIPGIGPLVYAQHLTIKVDGIPGETAELGGSHAGKDCGDEKRPPTPLGAVDNEVDLFL